MKSGINSVFSGELRPFEYSLSKEFRKQSAQIFMRPEVCSTSAVPSSSETRLTVTASVASETIKLPIAYVASGGAPYQHPNEEVYPLPIVCMMTRWNQVIYISELFIYVSSWRPTHLEVNTWCTRPRYS